MMTFDHIGLVTGEKHPGETWVEQTRVWVTPAGEGPAPVEWLRYAPDTPVTGPIRESWHIGFRTDDLNRDKHGMRELIPPFSPRPGLTVGFYQNREGVAVELMQEST